MKLMTDATYELVVLLHRARRDGRTSQADILVAERVTIQALEAEGFSWFEIGQGLGIEPVYARRMFEAFA